MAQGGLETDTHPFSEMIQLEIQKYFKGKEVTENYIADTSCFAADFAGTTCDSYANSSFQYGNCIIESNLREVKGIKSVVLPDGTEKQVKLIGDVFLNFSILLKEVLYIPKFNYNLLSVH